MPWLSTISYQNRTNNTVDYPWGFCIKKKHPVPHHDPDDDRNNQITALFHFFMINYNQSASINR